MTYRYADLHCTTRYGRDTVESAVCENLHDRVGHSGKPGENVKRVLLIRDNAHKELTREMRLEGWA